MELPMRDSGDQLLPPGELVAIRGRLRSLASRHDLSSVIACAFDHRTRMLPFIFADLRMAPAGCRAVGSALVDSGFNKTRIVLQQWNKHFQPSQMRLEGRLPDLLLISTMSIHTTPFRAMLRDICRIEPDKRPLVLVGGSMCMYEPWEAFYTHNPERGERPTAAAADVAVTGEEYVLLNLLETLLGGRNGNEPLRRTFLRARDSGALDSIPGLMYARTDAAGVPQELVDTGIQRLVGDLDEHPFPDIGYSILEAPSSGPGLAAQPLPAKRVRRHSPIGSLAMTFGCKFSCEYCPIPAYNQRHHRGKSPERLREELFRLTERYRIRYYFGTDDNFLNNKPRAVAILETLAGAERNGVKLHKQIRWGTEATVHDTLGMREHLRLMHHTGMRALWMGVEDMSGALVRKGQGHDKTAEAFQLLHENGIAPMAMMMHHDSQPLRSRGDESGLLNQIRLLRKAGAVSLQVLMITPSAGSKVFDSVFTSGQVIERVGGRDVEPYMYDGNHVIASKLPRPWQKQFNMAIAYMAFYNPWQFAKALFFPYKTMMKVKRVGMQIIGAYGLAQTLRRTAGWSWRLMFGRIERFTKVPAGPYPIRSVSGGVASHARGEWVPEPQPQPEPAQQEQPAK